MSSEPALAPNVKYRRVLLKLSGEALIGDQSYGLDPKIVTRLAAEIRDVHRMGVVLIVVSLIAVAPISVALMDVHLIGVTLRRGAHGCGSQA